MKLGYKTDEQKAHIEELFGNTSIWFCEHGDGINIDDWVSFDTLAAVVDYLRQPSDAKKELFEECWIAYRRKGSKKKALEYWKKLTDTEKENVLVHIKAYTSTRELQYQKDFERYLRDKVFMTIVFNGNKIVYDPTKIGKGETVNEVYMPTCDGALSWNEYYKCFMYVGFWDGRHIADGYNDDNRPHGATITLNNGRGTITWNRNSKQWEKV